MTLVENLQREDLNPIEQARAFQRLTEEFRLTQEQVAERTGKDRATVANSVRLLQSGRADPGLARRGPNFSGPRPRLACRRGSEGRGWIWRAGAHAAE